MCSGASASGPRSAPGWSACRDPDVAIHAMSALRRAVGNAEALPVLLQIAATHAEPRVRENAARAANKAEKAIATSSTN